MPTTPRRSFCATLFSEPFESYKFSLKPRGADMICYCNVKFYLRKSNLDGIQVYHLFFWFFATFSSFKTIFFCTQPSKSIDFSWKWANFGELALRDYWTDFHRLWRVEKPLIRCFQPFARRNPCISELRSGARSFHSSLRKIEARRREPP